jgi:hypothetical protein
VLPVAITLNVPVIVPRLLDYLHHGIVPLFGFAQFYDHVGQLFGDRMKEPPVSFENATRQQAPSMRRP